MHFQQQQKLDTQNVVSQKVMYEFVTTPYTGIVLSQGNQCDRSGLDLREGPKFLFYFFMWSYFGN